MLSRAEFDRRRAESPTHQRALAIAAAAKSGDRRVYLTLSLERARENGDAPRAAHLRRELARLAR